MVEPLASAGPAGSAPITAHDQTSFQVRLEQGQVGGRRVGAGADVAVVVDVLSFTTTLTVAAERGVEVWPCPWGDADAARLAATHDAVLAVGRRAAGPGEVSLSPPTVREADDLRRLVLPSPNGSALAVALRESGTLVVAASLRNSPAVAGWLAGRLVGGSTVALVPAGERWPDGSLRPAVEDLWGAGAVLDALLTATPVGDLTVSPEADAALAAWVSARSRPGGLGAALADTASGRELVDGGFAADVALAAEHDVTGAVPVLDGDRFVPTHLGEPPVRGH